MLETALAYAALGYRPVPLHGLVDGTCTCPAGPVCGKKAGKHPREGGWQRTASAAAEAVRKRSWTNSNVGLATGSGLVVLDFDGADGLRTLRDLLDVLPPLPTTTPLVRTGGGGAHLYLADDPLRPAKSTVRLLRGMDVRGAGGQVVAPPSSHLSGRSYEWLAPLVHLDELPETPEWTAVAHGEIPHGMSADAPSPEELLDGARKWRGLLKRGLAGEPLADPGARDTTMTRLAGHLAHRWGHVRPAALAAPFRASFEAMSAASEGAPPFEKFVGAIRRFQVAAEDDDLGRPTIEVTPETDRVAQLGVRALVEAHHRLLVYRHGDHLAEVQPAAEGLPARLRLVDRDAIGGVLSEAARWVRPTEDGPKQVKPPDEILRRTLTLSPWDGVSRLDSVSSDYILRPDGSFFAGGYDDQTCAYVYGQSPAEPYNESTALSMLVDVVDDFPFESSLDLAVWLAGVLTAASLDLYPGATPGFLVDANTLGAGKTKLAMVSTMIATGRPPKVLDISRDDVENQKVITSSAIAGDRHLLVDNVVGKFGTVSLAKALTLGDAPWSGRVLGKSKTWTGTFRPIWWVTANNATLQHDLSRRFLRCRLKSDMEHPRDRRGFKHPDLEGYVAAHRAELRLAVLSILRAQLLSGEAEPAGVEPFGSFEGWAGLVRACVVRLGFPDPVASSRSLESEDELSDDLAELLEHLAVAFGERAFLTREVIDAGWGDEASRDLADAIQAIYPPARRGIPSSRGLGKLFQRVRDKISAGRRLVRDSKAHGRQSWRIECI